MTTYKNPIGAGLEEGMRDCQILKDGDKWFMTGTSPGFWCGEENPGIKLYSSDNLTNWHCEGLLIDRSKLAPEVWYHDRFWAPELHQWKGRWYLSFNCRNEAKEHPHPHGCGLAVANDIRGPYEIITKEKPIADGNDFHLFFDNGKAYAFWNSGWIFLSEIDLENGKLVGETRKLFTKSPDKNDWDHIGIEGSWCIKRDGRYILFYSSWTRGYEVGYATAETLEGPWTKSPHNPIYGEIDPELCAKHEVKEPPKHSAESPFLQAGHNAIFTGPDGRLWTSCHGIVKGGIPLLCIDPLKFNGKGEIVYSGPSWTTQTI